MNADRTAWLSLLLSAITLAVVLAIAVRPAPEPVDNTPAVLEQIEDLQSEMATLQQNVTDLRTLVEAGGDSDAASQIVLRLDRIEGTVAAVGAKIDAICAAIQSSPFAPSGFACP
ncbi:MAG TPA: hypothetical protein VGQ58_04355 [Candidatus Limnocylindrales bacterium]|nr:hypothetical protein [Candidatus Limnocylindrales bacterium]